MLGYREEGKVWKNLDQIWLCKHSSYLQVMVWKMPGEGTSCHQYWFHHWEQQWFDRYLLTASVFLGMCGMEGSIPTSRELPPTWMVGIYPTTLTQHYLFGLSNYSVFFIFSLLPFSPLPLNLKSPEHLFYIECLGVVQQTSLRTTRKMERKTWPFTVQKPKNPNVFLVMGGGGVGRSQATYWCLEPVLANKAFEMRTLMFCGCCIATSLWRRK